MHMKDIESRKREEDVFNLTREIQSLKSDCKNMQQIELTLQTEINDLREKRRSLEEINQSLKNQLCETNIQIRQISS